MWFSNRADRQHAEAQEAMNKIRREKEKIITAAMDDIRFRLKCEMDSLERAKADFAIVKDAARFAIAALKDSGNKDLAEEYERKLLDILSL